MRIAVLGTGEVGRRLADGFAKLGHSVILGARQTDNPAAHDWARAAGDTACAGSFAEAAAAADLAVLAVMGEHAVAAAEAANAGGALDGKILIDVTNPLDFSNGFPPTLTQGLNNSWSLGEAVQAALPKARVVKTLNTVSNLVMTDPGRLAEPTDLFLCGEDSGAKAEVARLLAGFGWRAPIDLGGISAARGTEAWLLLWTRMFAALGTAEMNLRIVRAA